MFQTKKDSVPVTRKYFFFIKRSFTSYHALCMFIKDAPYTDFAGIRPAGYPAILKAGYRTSGYFLSL